MQNNQRSQAQQLLIISAGTTVHNTAEAVSGETGGKLALKEGGLKLSLRCHSQLKGAIWFSEKSCTRRSENNIF